MISGQLNENIVNIYIKIKYIFKNKTKKKKFISYIDL